MARTVFNVFKPKATNTTTKPKSNGCSSCGQKIVSNSKKGK